MNPGDLVAWRWQGSGALVRPDAVVWSSTMKRGVSIGGTALLVGLLVTDVIVVTWLNDRGLFHSSALDWSDMSLQRSHTMSLRSNSTLVIPAAAGTDGVELVLVSSPTPSV